MVIDVLALDQLPAEVVGLQIYHGSCGVTCGETCINTIFDTFAP